MIYWPTFIKKLNVNRCVRWTAVPYPLVITSDPEGSWPYMYYVTWEKPYTGGLVISEYDFRFRRVSIGL